ncbi:hypothetical protein L226DRAFT_548519 [Lentinus tigrinus ALCF2SS1-7]|uniref:Uncharacterized protein n=1 Tax=Lentinus tigrinus ALCF2SS1-6 TaxID=1328759 RepID=A0A5C2RXM0_9APHY|nr:hypothetical protein L227DRAFT_588418 [Lentinus tigrinus ALCF2SS1-6]RPD68527.1 hypothetical protein L226DRAFT_548519 [Lentinus tigrinus ALCF2SS1-7]
MALRTASLDKSGLSEEVLYWLRNPPHQPRAITPVERVGICMYLARGDASEANYADNRAAFLELHPDDPIPSYEAVKNLVAELTDVSAIRTEMCDDTCVAFTGPFANCLECPRCKKPRYDPVEFERGRQIPRRTFLTFPLGPQLQAMWASPENAQLMGHRRRETDRILVELAAMDGDVSIVDHIYYGNGYTSWAATSMMTPQEKAQKDIQPDDMVVLFSIDGAQLYASKSSDCWFYIWKRYVLPGAVIGGPNKPKNIDSFLFPGLYHVTALQRDSFPIWNAAENRLILSNVYLYLVTADSPAMAYLNGLVGHNGKHGCRIYCPQKSRHKPGLPNYYPALGRYFPDDSGSSDYSIALRMSAKARYDIALAAMRAARTKRDYVRERLQTGIAKSSIFSGLPERHFLGVPGAFVLDLMHLISLNLTDLIVSLLRGTLSCDSTDDKATWDFAIFAAKTPWKKHGKLVASCGRYLPGSFDRIPRDSAEKISSGYKAWEFLLYVYGLLPGLLRAVQHEKYYQHFCLLVVGVCILLQHHQRLDLLPRAHQSIVQYLVEYEELYYCRRADRLHFVRPSLHTLGHVVSEVLRIGPGSLHSQWTLENFIGNITREIKQHVTPYANVSERAFRRCQVNALKAIIPAFADPDAGLPQGAVDLGDGYALLRARDHTEHGVTAAEEAAIFSFLREHFNFADNTWIPVVCRWARLALPTGQVARSGWKEVAQEARGKQPHRSRMVKLAGDRFTEVQYFFAFQRPGGIRGNDLVGLAMVMPFSAPDRDLLAYSNKALLVCFHQGDQAREVVFAKGISSVVAMVPLPMTALEAQAAAQDPATRARYVSRFFVVEKPGLDTVRLAGRVEDPSSNADGFQFD